MKVRLPFFPHLALAAAIGFYAGLATRGGDARNDRPRYGSLGLPSNCRALVQANIDGYNSKTYTADEVIASLARNCGAAGALWER